MRPQARCRRARWFSGFFDQRTSGPRKRSSPEWGIRTLVAKSPNAAEGGRLTPRQAQVLALVDEGLSNKEIAQRLSIQEQTVKNHMHRILRKFGVHRRSEAAARMRRRRGRSPNR